jgi:hypothetical protein
LADDGVEVIDTSVRLADSDPGVPADGAHPAVLVDRARRCVEAQREQLERALAQEWCDAEDAPLYIDGGIARRERVSASPLGVGVVKRHHVLYGGGDAVPLLAALGEGERTAVFYVGSHRWTPVWSWYLRLRDATNHDPMWGLVRLESATAAGAAVERGEEKGERRNDGMGSDSATSAQVTARADEVSRWVLAERVPLALPDPQWHALAYGIRDCKEMLRAIM